MSAKSLKQITAYEMVRNCMAVNLGRELPNRNSDSRCPGCICKNACDRFINEFGDIPFKFISQVYPSSPLTNRVFSNIDLTKISLRTLCRVCKEQLNCDVCPMKDECEIFCKQIHLTTTPCKLIDIYGKPFDMDKEIDV